MANKRPLIHNTPERQRVIDAAVAELRKRGWHVEHYAERLSEHKLRSPPHERNHH